MAELQRKKQKSVGTVCKDAIMTGISYMIPVIVGGGVITAIAKMMGGYNIGNSINRVSFHTCNSFDYFGVNTT